MQLLRSTNMGFIFRVRIHCPDLMLYHRMVCDQALMPPVPAARPS